MQGKQENQYEQYAQVPRLPAVLTQTEGAVLVAKEVPLVGPEELGALCVEAELFLVSLDVIDLSVPVGLLPPSHGHVLLLGAARASLAHNDELPSVDLVEGGLQGLLEA